MKTSVVPAQVTSLEDVIAANLTLTQLVLLVIPVFLSALIFVGLPPVMHLKPYKLGLLFILSSPFLVLAIRVRGQVLFKWMIVLSSYKLRPHLYLFSLPAECDCHSRLQTLPETVASPAIESRIPFNPEAIDPKKFKDLEEVLGEKRIQFRLSSKGVLNALIENK